MIPATSETPDYGYTRGTRSGQNRLKQTQIAEIQDRKETKIRVKTPKRKSLKWSGNELKTPNPRMWGPGFLFAAAIRPVLGKAIAYAKGLGIISTQWPA